MKRFVGYVTLCASIFIGLGVGFIPTVKGIKGSADYASSKEFVFKISDRVITDGEFNGTDENTNLLQDEGAIDEIIQTFESRLDAIQISNYKVTKMGEDMISVIFKAENDSYYSDITEYLTFSWSFMASTYSESPVTIGNSASLIQNGSTSNDFFTAGSASIEYKNNYPYIVIELSDNGAKFKDLYEKAKGEESGDPTNKNLHVLKEGEGSEEEATKPENKIYILNDWLDGLSIKDLVDKKETDNLSMSEYHKHVLFEFDATKPESFFWNFDSTDVGKEDNFKKIYFGGYNLNGSANEGANYGSFVNSASDVYFKSLVWLNMFNASTYKYQVTYLNQYYPSETLDNTVPPLYENLVYMSKVRLSLLMIATLAAIVIVTLVYCLNFGANGLIGSLTTFGVGIISLALFNLLGVEFNIGAILGILTLTIMGIISSMSLFYKVKKEIYTGKNFKKAFIDGSKKAQWIGLDASIIGLLAGLIAYLIPNAAISSFGIIVMIGSVLNAILNILVLRGVSWFVYNSSYVASNPKVIALEKKFIPDLSMDEKPTYFEAFNTKKTKKKKVIAASIYGVVLVASIAGMIAFSSINGTLLNTPSSQQSSEIYIQQIVPTEQNAENYVVSFEEKFNDHFAKDKDGTALIKNLSVESYYFNFKNGNTTKYEYTYMISLEDTYSSTSTIYYRDDATSGTFIETPILEAFSSYAKDIVLMNNVSNENVELKEIYSVDSDSYTNYVFIFVGIALAVQFVYFIIRFGVNKAIVSTLLNACALFITIGLFSLVHVSASPVIILGLLVLYIVNTILFDFIYVGEKEKYKENRKVFKTDLAKRYEVFEETNNLDYYTIKNIILICCFPIIALIFAPSVNKLLLALLIVGLLASVPTLNFLSLEGQKICSKVYLFITKGIKFTKKEKQAKIKKGEEGPEEAVFTGIND